MLELELCGAPIAIEFRHSLRASRGKLLHGGNAGAEVHAGSFLRERRIILDSALRHQRRERDRILAHELFHFVWLRLPNKMRRSYRELIDWEWNERIQGEMGWSAEWRKQRLTSADWNQRTRAAREYLCESFCDTAAAAILNLRGHSEITLSALARRYRRLWMEENLGGKRLHI